MIHSVSDLAIPNFIVDFVPLGSVDELFLGCGYHETRGVRDLAIVSFLEDGVFDGYIRVAGYPWDQFGDSEWAVDYAYACEYAAKIGIRGFEKFRKSDVGRSAVNFVPFVEGCRDDDSLYWIATQGMDNEANR